MYAWYPCDGQTPTCEALQTSHKHNDHNAQVLTPAGSSPAGSVLNLAGESGRKQERKDGAGGMEKFGGAHLVAGRYLGRVGLVARVLGALRCGLVGAPALVALLPARPVG